MFNAEPIDLTSNIFLVTGASGEMEASAIAPDNAARAVEFFAPDQPIYMTTQTIKVVGGGALR